jgi:hypothetical protein
MIPPNALSSPVTFEFAFSWKFRFLITKNATNVRAARSSSTEKINPKTKPRPEPVWVQMEWKISAKYFKVSLPHLTVLGGR